MTLLKNKAYQSFMQNKSFKILSILALFFIGVKSGVYAQENNEKLSPYGKWNIDYNDTSCIASRRFANDTDNITFGIKVGYKHTRQMFFLAGESLWPIRKNGVLTRKKIQTSINNSEFNEFDSTSRLGKNNIAHIKWSPTYNSLIKPQEGKQNIIFQFSQKNTLQLLLGDMRPILSAIEKCQIDLAKFLKKDPSKYRKLFSDPILVNYRKWISAKDYPRSALFNDQEGKVSFTALIDRTGKVESCSITQSSGNQKMDAIVCKKLNEKAIFKPAISADGKPTSAEYSNSISFNIDSLW